MHRAFLPAACALCACAVVPAAAGAANVKDLLPTTSAASAFAVLGPASPGAVAQAASVEQVTISAYTRSIYACVSRRTGHHRVERAVDRIVRTTTTASAAETKRIRLDAPRINGVLRCRRSERLRRVRTSFTDIVARTANGQSVLVDGSFLNGS